MRYAIKKKTVPPSAKQQRKVAIFTFLKSCFRCSSRRSFLNCPKLYMLIYIYISVYINTCDRVANAVKTVLNTLLSVEL